MQVFDIMTPGVAAVDADTNLLDAAKQMKEKDIGLLPVMSGDRILGVLTDRDLVIRAVAEETDLKKTKVSDIVSDKPVVIHPDDTVDHAAKMFAQHQVRRIIVVDETQRPVGVLSLGDLAVEISDDQMVSNVLRQISKPLHH